jgi:TolB protein
MKNRFPLIAILIAFAAVSGAQTGSFASSADVGETPVKGSAAFDSASGEYRVTGGGANIWAAADAFHFAWTKVSGDVSITADVRFPTAGAVAHRKAVLMIRQSLEPGAAYADAALHGDGLTSLQFRPAAGAETQEIRWERKAAGRLRLVRRGAQFTMYAGNAGEELQPVGPATAALEGPVYVGLGVCSHQADILETAVFSNVRIEQASRPRYRSKISVYDRKKKTVRTVYASNDEFEAPNWSRDGMYLLTNAGGRLFKVLAKGSAPQIFRLGADLNCNNDHDYSRDGARLAISATSAESRQSRIYVAQADGSLPKLVVSKAPSYFHGWSPDGRWLAFVGQRNGHYNLFRVPSTGGEEERLTSKPAYDDGPDYSPDGKWIYFNSDRSGGWDIWRMPASGAGQNDSKAERVTNDALEDWFPHPSPDGKWLVFLSFPKGTKTHNDKMEGLQLRIIKAPGENAKPVKPQALVTIFGGQGTMNVNSWSPDSRYFGFVIYEALQ